MPGFPRKPPSIFFGPSFGAAALCVCCRMSESELRAYLQTVTKREELAECAQVGHSCSCSGDSCCTQLRPL